MNSSDWLKNRGLTIQYVGTRPHQPNPEWGDAGYDLHVEEGGYVTSTGATYLNTGTAVQLPEGYWGLLIGRSSAEAKLGVRVLTGVIDNGWRGELLIGVQAHHQSVYIDPGTRLAQIIPMVQAPPMQLVRRSVLDDHGRGVQGFGSSGQ